ncbi:MAG TPA: Ig-like domain-containing protein [Candidatus Paceibacterota bacterium]|nr:Ig-like domain-containing protein [Candidatus Paceibacterota bacterium]
MRYIVALALLLILLPSCAFAAGFAKQSLFLSKTPVTEGETVLIHAVVANDTTTKFVGEVVFKDADIKVGSIATTIAAGGANAVSVSWKPAAGSHTITAELTSDGDMIVAQESAIFSIEEKPKPVSTSTQAAAAVESSQKIQDTINQYVPAAGGITEPVFSALDSVRAKAADALDKGIDWAKSNSSSKKSSGQVLGTSTSTVPVGALGTAYSVLASILFYILSFLRWGVENPGIFYPAFVLIFFYILWKTYKRFRRPSYE